MTKYDVNALYRGDEVQVDLIEGTILGEKISTSGIVLDPYEAVLENTGDEPFKGIPEEMPDKKWMYQDEIDEGKPTFPNEWFEKDQSVR